MILLLLNSTLVNAQMCFISKDTSRIDKISTCDHQWIQQNIIPSNGSMLDSVHIYEFINDSQLRLIIVQPENFTSLGIPNLLTVMYSYKKENGYLVTTNPKGCVQKYSYYEGDNEIQMVTAGMSGNCGAMTQFYSDGKKTAYVKFRR